MYQLLKDQKTKRFEVTQEALDAFKVIKEYISKTTMLYHVDFSLPLYLSCDASNYGLGAFLYQVKVYEKNESGQKKMLDDLNFCIEESSQQYVPYMLPGVAPGKQTPQVNEFLKDPNLSTKYDVLNTLDTSMTMTEKVQFLNENFVLHVRPIAFYSKSFSDAQVKGYQTMEKENAWNYALCCQF